MKENIAIIGGGNIGLAIAEGLINSGKYEGKQITITRRKVQLLDYLKKKA
ncbi:MAG: NAD(P)-binding domain-containing protein [Bacteroidota bacterium]|nr:NAD(P)-binding domain-containing protein [Bacteroidota bacterium]